MYICMYIYMFIQRHTNAHTHTHTHAHTHTRISNIECYQVCKHEYTLMRACSAYINLNLATIGRRNGNLCKSHPLTHTHIYICTQSLTHAYTL